MIAITENGKPLRSPKLVRILQATKENFNCFINKIPSSLNLRAGKPPTGLHLDVTKDDKLIQKLMVDEKKCYLFGRNAQLNDFVIDHASCSRVHAAFVYHKFLNITYLVDLGSSK